MVDRRALAGCTSDAGGDPCPDRPSDHLRCVAEQDRGGNFTCIDMVERVSCLI